MEYFAEPSPHPPTAKIVFKFGFLFFNALNLPKLSEIKLVKKKITWKFCIYSKSAELSIAQISINFTV